MHDNPFVFLRAIRQRITQPLELNAVGDSLRRHKGIVDLSLHQSRVETRVDQEDINILGRVLEVTKMLLIVKQRTCGRRVIIFGAGDKEKLVFDAIPKRRDRLSQRANSPRTESTKRKTVVMIARADDIG